MEYRLDPYLLAVGTSVLVLFDLLYLLGNTNCSVLTGVLSIILD